MVTKPKFKDCFHIEPVAPNRVFILTESHYWVLDGDAYHKLMPYLNGEYESYDIIQQLSGQVSASKVLSMLQALQKRGYITEAQDELDEKEAAFWYLIGADAPTVTQQLAQKTVALEVVGDVDAEPLRTALASLNIQTVSADSPNHLRVCVVDDYLNPQLKTINEQARRDNVSWMPVTLQGAKLWLGPIFIPLQNACWECLSYRLRHNRQVDSYLIRNSDHSDFVPRVQAALPTTAQIAANMVATEIAKWLANRGNAQLLGNMLTFDTLKSSTEWHPVTRRPQCHVCGEPEIVKPQPPITLQSQPKALRNDGGHRQCTPEETFDRYSHLISPLTGVINWLESIRDEPNGLVYSYVAGHNFALIKNDVNWLRRTIRFNTGGKGMTELQAKVSAMGEAIERYSAVYRGNEPTTHGSYAELAPKALHVEALTNFSDAQYANRDALNGALREGSYQVIANRFDETLPIDWTSVWSMTHMRERLVPTAYCYFGHADTDEYFYCMGNSNGCAAGNSAEEAILQATYELIERDATAIWWYNRLRRPAVDLDSFNLPYLRQLTAHYTALGREYWVLDITNDLGIPTFVAVSRRTDRPVEDIILGLGCHADAQTALLRAVSEMNQFLPVVSHSKPDGTTAYAYSEGDAIDWWQQATIADNSYLLPSTAAPRRKTDFADISTDDLKQDVELCVERFAAAGLEMLLLDMTRPDIGMSVFRVIVPELRHFWRRLGKGRLYDVPVQMGWLDAPVAENDLNPYSIFF